jgi:2-C-methyl-D-erythritol 4-phosphate cytidylyltransferase
MHNTPRRLARGVRSGILEWRPFIRLSANAADAAPMSSSRLFVLIPCAGSGSRAGTAGPCPSSTSAWRAAHGGPHAGRLCASQGASPGWRWWCRPGDARGRGASPPFPRRTNTCCAWAAATRAASVANGLRELRRPARWTHDWVLVHDAARCLVTPSWSTAHRRLRRRRGRRPAGASAGRHAEGVERRRPRGPARSPRADKWLAQTPQMFRIGMLRRRWKRRATP